MATNLNTFTLCGNVTADPKVLDRQNGGSVVLFTLAVNQGDNVDFVPVQLRGAQYSDSLKTKLVKGAGVLLNGRLEHVTYQKNGENKKYFSVQPTYLIVGPRGPVNTGVIMGRLTADPVMHKSSNNKDFATITIACNRSYKDAKGEWVDAPTTFMDVILWENQARFVCNYFRKGSAIIVQGRLQTRQYKDKNNESRTSYEIVGQTVSFGEGKSENNTSSAAPQAQQPARQATQATAQPAQNAAPSYGYATYSAADFEAVADDEDLPF